MLRVYAHLTPTDAENDLNRIMGVVKEDRVATLSDVASPVQCKACGMVNPKSNQFCGGCFLPLSDDVKDRYDSMLTDIQSHPMFKKFMQDALQDAISDMKIENGAQI
jgi:predicted amidophosphoribosyltransferase